MLLFSATASLTLDGTASLAVEGDVVVEVSPASCCSWLSATVVVAEATLIFAAAVLAVVLEVDLATLFR